MAADYGVIATNGYVSNIGVLCRPKGGDVRAIYVGAQGCKDYVHDGLTFNFYPDYGANYGIADNRQNRDVKIDPNDVEFFIYVRAGVYKETAEIFTEFMADLEDRMGLEKRVKVIKVDGYEAKVKKPSATHPLVVSVHEFWVKSPVCVSMFLTLLRSCEVFKKGQTFDKFVDDTVHYRINFGKDAGYIRVAHMYGNINGFISRSLPCMNREGFSDYLLSHHNRGITWYDAQNDHFPMTEKELIAKRNFKRSAYKPGQHPVNVWGGMETVPIRPIIYDVDKATVH